MHAWTTPTDPCPISNLCLTLALKFLSMRRALGLLALLALAATAQALPAPKKIIGERGWGGETGPSAWPPWIHTLYPCSLPELPAMSSYGNQTPARPPPAACPPKAGYDILPNLNWVSVSVQLAPV